MMQNDENGKSGPSHKADAEFDEGEAAAQSSSHKKALQALGQNMRGPEGPNTGPSGRTQAEFNKGSNSEQFVTAQEAFEKAVAASEAAWKEAMRGVKPSSEMEFKDLYLNAHRASQEALRSVFQRHMLFEKYPHLKPFQVSQDHLHSQWNKGTGSTKPSSELYDYATLVKDLRNRKLKTIKQIVVVGLDDPELKNVQKKMDLQSGKIFSGNPGLSDKQIHFFEQIPVLEKIQSPYKHKHNIDLRVEVVGRDLPEGFKTVLKQGLLGIKMNIRPDAKMKCSETAGTLLYDIRWPEDVKPGEKSVVRLLATWKEDELPLAVLAPSESINVDKDCEESKEDYQ